MLSGPTAFPFPEDFLLRALEGVKEALCIEELSPYIEEQILKTAGKHHLALKVSGKLDGSVPHNGENSVELSSGILDRFLGIQTGLEQTDISDAPALPVRPPVLCAGCPHRASFYAVKQAMKGKKAVFCGDIGCYTLGNAMPLDMVDTCLCMGAGITMAQGMSHMNPDTVSFAFVGDSTFFASGMTGVVNATTGSLTCKATFPNPEGHLYSGIQGTVVLPYSRNDVMVIPQTAVVRLQDKSLVYKVKADSTATAVDVTTADTGNGKDFIITSGLNVGDKIVTIGANNVTEGQKVLFPEEAKSE